ncbi:hypothetical protein [Clostridium felsineum]|uniref:hypothetical protein n=1 Tax=Clostridium felsineum TaxID=36839 RepID=UPI0009C7B62E|nr:hypothetical protein [Clostridium felsineum]URZ16886.1 hypothetical protein CLFE_029330 [Clostridium felsineum DSM 794]
MGNRKIMADRILTYYVVKKQYTEMERYTLAVELAKMTDAEIERLFAQIQK